MRTNTFSAVFRVRSIAAFAIHKFFQERNFVYVTPRLHKDDYRWYLDLRKYGGTRHAGFGLGFERAIMYMTGMSNIRDVISFPRTPKQQIFKIYGAVPHPCRCGTGPTAP